MSPSDAQPFVGPRPVVVLVHGWNVSNPELTVGRLRDAFEARGYIVEHLLYGYLPFTWQVTRRNPKIAAKLAGRVKRWQDNGHAVDVVGHSNGCTIIHLACQWNGLRPRTVEAINPALRDTLHPAPGADLVHVWHNSGDTPVTVSKWISWLPWSHKWRPWGDMGRDGFRGGLGRGVVNLDTLADFPVAASGHSTVFKDPYAGFYLPTIAAACSDEWLSKPVYGDPSHADLM